MLTEGDVLSLDLVRKRDRLLHRLPTRARPRLREEPFEDRERLVDAQREDEVGAHVVLVDVEHRVREDPVVEGVLLTPRLPDVAPVTTRFLTRLQLPDGGMLLRVVGEGLPPVRVVAPLLTQP